MNLKEQAEQFAGSYTHRPAEACVLVRELLNEILNLETDLASKKAVIAEQAGVRKKTAIEAIGIVQEWRNSNKLIDKLVHTFGVYDDIYGKKEA
jgi:hypothetical protein